MDPGKIVFGRKVAVEMMSKLQDLIQEVIRLMMFATVPFQCQNLQVRSSRRSTDSQVDAVRIKRMEHSKNLGHLHWAVVWQQDSARPDANRYRFSGNPGD